MREEAPRPLEETLRGAHVIGRRTNSASGDWPPVAPPIKRAREEKQRTAGNLGSL